MNKPVFDVLCIMRNNANTLPRMFDSLANFQERGGRIIICDTGSVDNSVEIARSRGAEVTECGDRFVHVIDADTAKAINERFIVGDEPLIVEAGSRYFHFSEARNFCSSLATNDWVAWIDSDEAFVRLDIDKLNEAMSNPAVAHLEYLFCYAWQRPPEGPDDFGVPGLEFVQSKTFRRSRMSWGDLPIHELVTPLPDPAPGGFEHLLLPKEVFYLGHWQEPSSHRSAYAVGLAVACWEKPTHDRSSHYAGREMLWTGRPRSAIKELERHVAMGGWPAERAHSLLFMGDAYGQLKDEDSQLACYSKAYHTDPSRRECLLRLAHYFRGRNHVASAAYAAAALEVPFSPFYATDMRDFGAVPHELLYASKGWQGDIAGAQYHLKKVLEYEPNNPEAARDMKFYFGYDISEAPEGWMNGLEMLWLFENAQGKARVLEVGSWKGRSTHALCTGAAHGQVWAVDHFQGSVGEDVQHAEAKADPESVFKQFTRNTAQFDNLHVCRADSLTAAKGFPEGFFDLIFLDASHDESSVRADLLAWRSKCRGILAGHDFSDDWPGVKAAVLSIVGQPDGVEGAIWHKKVEAPAVNPLLLYLTDCVRKGLPVSFVKNGDGEQLCMAGAQGGNCDGHPYSPELGWKLKMAFSTLDKMAADRREGRTRVNVVPFKDQPFFNCLLHRHDNNLDAVKAFWGAVRESDKQKIFVGPDRLHPVVPMLKVTHHFRVPLVNAFSDYSDTRKRVLERLRPGTIFIFSAGFISKVLIAELLQACPDISCIDAGSCWDPLFVGPSRTEQLPMDLLKHEYRDWLEG